MSFDDLVVSKWGARFCGREFPVSIGRGGIGEKRGEGDGISPVGVWRVEEWRYRPDRLIAPYKPTRPQDGWSDASDDTLYNQLVQRPYSGSHERLYRADHLYDLIGVLDYNRRPILPGQGSAIFLHSWRRPRFPTEGCIAFSPLNLRFIAENWQPKSRVIIQ